jgi:hypothetical protein
MNRIRFKSKAMLAFFAFMAMLLFFNTAKSQTNSSTNWTYYSEQSGVKVYYKIVKCSTALTTDPLGLVNSTTENVVLKFENQDASTKQISWNKNLSNSNSTEISNTSLIGFSTSETSCGDSPLIKLKETTNSIGNTSVKEALMNLNLTISTN